MSESHGDGTDLTRAERASQEKARYAEAKLRFVHAPAGDLLAIAKELGLNIHDLAERAEPVHGDRFEDGPTKARVAVLGDHA